MRTKIVQNKAEATMPGYQIYAQKVRRTRAKTGLSGKIKRKIITIMETKRRGLP